VAVCSGHAGRQLRASMLRLAAHLNMFTCRIMLMARNKQPA
jgi:hypothetical protein